MAFLKSIVKLILYQPLFNILIFLVWLTPGHNIAWAIIVLTIIVRVILLPSSLKAVRQQKRMRDLQPEIQKLQAQYKDDKQKQAQVLMDFYKKNKINPLGSCLPLLIQLPILIVLYYVFLHGLSVDYFNLLYGFMPRPEFIKTVFLGIDLAKPDKWILPIIAGILQYIQGRQIMPARNATQSVAGGPPPAKAVEKGQEMQNMLSKQMLYLMPIFTVFIAGRLPAALPLYWIVTNAFSIAQQWWVFRDSKPLTVNRSPQNIDTKEEKKNVSKKHGVEITVRKKGEK